VENMKQLKEFLGLIFLIISATFLVGFFMLFKLREIVNEARLESFEADNQAQYFRREYALAIITNIVLLIINVSAIYLLYFLIFN